MSESSPTRLSQLEIDCLKVLWKKRAASVAEVRSSMSRPLAYTTVMTILDRMVDKGAVARRKSGRAYVYSPALDLESARAQAVHRLLDNLFDHDPHSLVQFVLQHSDTQRERRSRQRNSAPLSTWAEMDETLL